MNMSAGIRSIALSFPKNIRTNDYWREKYPDLVEGAEKKNLAKLFPANGAKPSSKFSKAMIPHLKDPFRGSVERRVLSEGETALSLEYEAASEALKAAKLSPDDVDLMLVASIFSNDIAPGNAAFLARDLGLRGAAWNVESTCSSALAAFQTAGSMIQAQQYRNVLVVVSNTYTRFADERDSFSWFLGDGAGAVVFSQLQGDRGVLGTKILHTGMTCGAFFSDFIIDENVKNDFSVDKKGKIKMMIRARDDAGQALKSASQLLRDCCEGAAAAAGVTLDDIKFFAFNSPTAWYVDVCVEALGIDPNRTIDLHSRYANIGAALPLANLYHGAQMEKMREDDLVLVYTLGTSSSVGAMVMRWGEVALGPAPALPLSKRKTLAEVG